MTDENKKANSSVEEPELVEPQADQPADETADLLKQLSQTQAEAEEMRGKFMRSVADLENFRKRVAREKEELRRYGIASLIEELLPALDNMQLGLQSAQDHHPEAKAVTDGIEMVVGQLMNVLKQHGLEEVNPKGQDFDPNLHEGVSHVPSDEFEEGKVSQVLRIGYTLNGRLLRPANVVVSSGKPTESNDK